VGRSNGFDGTAAFLVVSFAGVTAFAIALTAIRKKY